MENESSKGIGVIAEVSSLTIQDEAMLETGRKLLLNSVDDLRNYCQQMINVAIGAIPIYLAILKLWFPNDEVAPARVSIFFAVPAFLFLLAMLSFSLGYLPQIYEINIGNLDSIEVARSNLMSYRAKWGLIGFSLFCLGIVVGIICILFAT